MQEYTTEKHKHKTTQQTWAHAGLHVSIGVCTYTHAYEHVFAQACT